MSMQTHGKSKQTQFPEKKMWILTWKVK